MCSFTVHVNPTDPPMHLKERKLILELRRMSSPCLGQVVFHLWILANTSLVSTIPALMTSCKISWPMGTSQTLTPTSYLIVRASRLGRYREDIPFKKLSHTVIPFLALLLQCHKGFALFNSHTTPNEVIKL